MIAANIVASVTTSGTIIDFDGKFNLQLGIDLIVSALEITCMGFESQKIKIKEERSQEINVTQEEEMQLGEIVVVGYGIPAGECKIGAVSDGIEISEKEDLEIENDTLNIPAEISIEHISPNPFTNAFRVLFESSINESFDFRLFSSDGRLLWGKKQMVRKDKNTIIV